MLLESPNPKDPQDAQVAKMMMEEPEYFKLMAHDWAVKHAGAPRTMPRPSEHSRKALAVEKPADDPQRYVCASSCGDFSPVQSRPANLSRYNGYHKNLVDRFTAMGFELEKVVEAFVRIGIERRGGADYEMEPAYVGDVIAYLFDEA